MEFYKRRNKKKRKEGKKRQHCCIRDYNVVCRETPPYQTNVSYQITPGPD